MVLDVGSLAVELVVDGPGRHLSVGAVQAALDSRAHRSGTQLLSRALRKTEEVALREHGGQRAYLVRRRECLKWDSPRTSGFPG